MGKRSGGTRGSNSSNASNTRRENLDFSIGEGAFKSIAPPSLGLGKDRVEQYAIKLGATKDSLKKALKLIDKHTIGGDIQKEADSVLYSEINRNTDLGKALRALSKVNKLHFEAWTKEYKSTRSYKDNKERELAEASSYAKISWPNNPREQKREIAESMKDFEKRQDYLRKIPVFRAGSHKNVESWTTSDEGVNFGNITVQTNLRSTVKDMLKDYYVFGISHSVGYAIENELIFVKKKR